jgi:hypothetical protein
MRSKTNFSKRLFFFLILLLPLNIGKHFEVLSSYVWGILSDYLVPTIYVQDLLVVAILFFWLREKGFPSKKSLADFFNKKSTQLIILFIISLGFSVLGSARPIPSTGIFLRVLLYSLLAFYISYEVVLEKDFPIILKQISLGLIVLCVVSVIQFGKQGSVFNNYLFFGEQPYTSSTWGVAREVVLGVAKIPAYGFFRHPNVFGGFLSLVLIWVYLGIETGGKDRSLFKISFCLGLVSLLLTFSYVAWAGFATGLLSYIFIRHYPKTSYLEKKRKIILIYLCMVFVVNILVPLFVNFQQPSLYRRGSLLVSSLRVARKFPLFGVGPGNLVAFVDDFRFIQPVHNIFLLILSECGIFSFVLFALIFALAIRRTLTQGYFFLFLVSLLQIIFEGSLDHYFWTIQQTLLLMWVLLGLVLTGKASQNSD